MGGGAIVGGRGCGKGQGSGGTKDGARRVGQGGGVRGAGWNLYLNEVLNKKGIVTH